MYPWDVLGLEPTDDRKAIKKAYAVLLKKHRPDEDPEGFQEINQAYQAALQAMKRVVSDHTPEVSRSYPSSGSSSSEGESIASEDSLSLPSEPDQTITPESPGSADEGLNFNLGHKSAHEQDVELLHPNPPEALLPIQTTHERPDEDIDINGPEGSEPDAQQRRQLQLAEDLFGRLHEVAFASMKDKAELDHWRFLSVYHDIEDFSLRDQVAREVFRRVAEYNLFQRKETGMDLIPPVVLHHMADLFNWEANWQAYSEHFPEHYLQCVFTELEKPVDRVRKAYQINFLRRVLAMSLDFLAYSLLVGLQSSFTGLTFKGQGFYYLFGFAAFRLLVELVTSNRTSLGANYLGYRILDHFLNRPSRMVQLKRFLALELMMTPLYLLIIGWFAWARVDIVLLVYALFMVLFLKFNNGRLPHDMLSGTVVVRKH